MLWFFLLLALPFHAWILFAALARFAPATLEALLMSDLDHYDIARDDENGGLYLRRYYLTPRHWKRKIFLHHILRSDTDASPHDHQWTFWSFILFGRYVEHVYCRRVSRLSSDVRKRHVLAADEFACGWIEIYGSGCACGTDVVLSRDRGGCQRE